LAAAILGVGYLPYLIVEIADGGRLILMFLPPDGKKLADHLPLTVALLSLAYPICGVFAAECEQRITYPIAPLLEAPEYLASF
jgi:hypothetical protein